MVEQVDATGIRWERIQLLIDLAVEPNEAFLRSIERPADRLAPRPSPAGSGYLRFNLFAGNDRMPLRAGRWQLMARPVGANEAVPVAIDPATVDRSAADRSFVHREWTIRVTPASSEGRLELEIAVWPTNGERPGGLPGSWGLVLRRVRQRIFRAAVAGLRMLPRRGRLVVFTSDSRATLGGNLELIHDRMIVRGLHRKMRLRAILKPSVRARRSTLDRLRLVWLLARADVILLDDYQPAIYQLEPHPAVRIIQLWHAWGAFKTVGYSRIGKPGGPNPFSKVHKNYTFATVSSEVEVPFYAEAFGLPEASAIPTGTPRMDEFLDPAHQAAGRERALAAYPIARDQEVILFAPTFRGDSAKRADYPIEMIDLEALHRVAVERGAVIILKLHPFVQRSIEVRPALADRIVNASAAPIDVNDLLLISDLLVTDYSSIVFESAALGLPMLFFAFDLDEYVASRDFYEPFTSFAPGRIVRTFAEMIDAIRAEDFEAHKVEPFAAAHLPPRGGSATDRIIDQLIAGP